ncbi:MAG: hypothetical protein JNL98_39725 [Bryobacterales bacterium]|nr:hypothetical protein [Bryobacterales bacterium]
MDTDQGRLCRYCQQPFQVSCFRPQQKVCSQPECQKQRRADYHRQKRHMDPVYAEVCRDSQQKWRAANPGYQKQYWHSHPAAAERNRQTQRQRDQRRQLHHLVKNTLALDLTAAGTSVFLIGPASEDLVKNTQLDLGPPLAV